MMRRRRMSPTSLGPGDLEQVTSGAPEDVKIARMRVAAQRLLHLQRQPVHAFAHVGPTDCWPHSNPARNRDHRRANASTTAAAKRATPKPGSARGVAREFDLDRRHRRYGDAIASPRHHP
jgi:hypothetical protein